MFVGPSQDGSWNDHLSRSGLEGEIVTRLLACLLLVASSCVTG